jgi:WD40 repeat protein
MHRVRRASIVAMHHALSDIAMSWDDESLTAEVRRYVFRHGVAHSHASFQRARAALLVTCLNWALARSTSEGAADALEWSRDVSATHTKGPTTLLSAWRHFSRLNAPLIAAGPSWWPAHKSLLQLATEHGQDSPVTQAAEAWLEAGRCDWDWLRRADTPKRWFDGRDAVFIYDQPITRMLPLNDRLAALVTGKQFEEPAAKARVVDLLSGRSVATWDAVDGVILRSGVLLTWTGCRLEFRAPDQSDLTSPIWSLELDGEVFGVVETDERRLFVWTCSDRCALISLDEQRILLSADLLGRTEEPQPTWKLRQRRGEPSPILSHGTSVFHWNERAVHRLSVQGDTAWELVFEVPTELRRIALTPTGGLFYAVKAIVNFDDFPPYMGTEMRFLPPGGEPKRVWTSANFAADGELLVMWDDGSGPPGYEDYGFKVLSEKTGGMLRDVQVHESGIAVVLSLGDGLFLSADEDATIALWSARSGDVIRRFAGHRFVDSIDGFRSGVQGLLRISAAHFASHDSSGRVQIFRLDDGEPLATFEFDGPLNCLKALDANHLIAWQGSSLSILGLTAEGARIDIRINVSSGRVGGVLPLESGRLLVEAEHEAIVVDRGLLSGLPFEDARARRSGGHLARLTSAGTALSWSPGRGDDRPVLWHTSTGQAIARFELPYRDPGVTSLSPHGLVLMGTSRISVEFWDPMTGEQLARIGGRQSGGRRGVGILELATDQWSELPGVDNLGIDPAATMASGRRVAFVQVTSMRGDEGGKLVAIGCQPFEFLGSVPTVEVESRVAPEVIADSCFLIRDDGAVCRWRPLDNPSELLVLEAPGCGATHLRLAGEGGCWNDSWGVHCIAPPAGDANPPRGAVLLVLRDDGSVTAQRLDANGELIGERTVLDGVSLKRLDSKATWSKDLGTLELVWSVYNSNESGRAIRGPISVSTGLEVSPVVAPLEPELAAESVRHRNVPRVTQAGWVAVGRVLTGPERQRLFVASHDGMRCQDLSRDGIWLGTRGDVVQIRHLHRGAQRRSFVAG